MSFVVGNIVRHLVLRTHQQGIDSLDTGDPVAVLYLSMSLNIILTTGEVPQEVTPVHEVQLIGEEETQVFGKGRLHHRFGLAALVELHRLPLDLCPLLVGLHMAAIRAVHTREQHIQFVHILIFGVMTRYIVPVFLIRIFLADACPYRIAFLRISHAGTPFALPLDFRNVGLSVQQRGLSVLLAGQVSTQRKDILRRVLVHRGISRRTDQGQGV